MRYHWGILKFIWTELLLISLIKTPVKSGASVKLEVHLSDSLAVNAPPTGLSHTVLGIYRCDRSLANFSYYFQVKNYIIIELS